MNKSSKLKKSLKEDAEFRFFDLFGNTISAVETYLRSYQHNPRKGILESINECKERFYRDLDEFNSSDYTPKGKINSNSLAKLYDFRSLDWTHEKDIERIKKYLHSLRSDK